VMTGRLDLGGACMSSRICPGSVSSTLQDGVSFLSLGNSCESYSLLVKVSGATSCFNAGFLGFGELLDVAIHRVLQAVTMGHQRNSHHDVTRDKQSLSGVSGGSQGDFTHARALRA